MKIAYKKKHLNINLILGLVWLAWFLTEVFIRKEFDAIDYGWFFISFLYLAIYFYQKKYKYLTIKNDTITVNGPFGKKMNLTDVKQIKSFAGDYILKTDKKELIINTKIIDPNSLAELNAELKKLDIKWS